MSEQVRIQCKYCGSVVEVSTEWIEKNERVFCGECCKAFDISVKDIPKKIDYPDFWD